MNEVALFRSALRAAVPTQPDPRLGADLVPQMARIAREASLRTGTAPAGLSGKRSRPRSRFALVARVGIAAATLPLLIAGLAFAGVTVPEPARSALESVGVDLPNQPADDGAGKESGAAGEATSKQDEPAPAAAPAEHKAAGQAQGKAKSKATTNAKAKTKTKTKSNGDDTSEPGRRVRRHGEGPIPGPASPPEGKALGQSNPGPSGQGSARSRGASRGKAGVGSRTVGVGSRKAGVGSRKAGVGSGKAVGSGNGQGAMRGSGQAK